MPNVESTVSANSTPRTTIVLRGRGRAGAEICCSVMTSLLVLPNSPVHRGCPTSAWHRMQSSRCSREGAGSMA